MQKLTRIAYNRENWRRPTGDAATHEIKTSYNSEHRFGHEDWLFRDEWQINGWRYAFLQGVNHSHAKLVRENAPFEVILFTIQPDKRRRYVAHIEDVECLDDIQAEDALDAFRQSGWLDLMKSEIQAIGGNVSALGDVEWAKHILNIRFRKENVYFFPVDTFASDTDPIRKINHYVLTDATPLKATLPVVPRRKGASDLPNENAYIRRAFGPVEVTPEHARMQKTLMEQLRSEYPGEKVVREHNFIDVLVQTDLELRLYEIKSDLSTRSVLRQSIGQLLEYSYFQIQSDHRTVTLIIVGRNALSAADAEYLSHLREKFGLPLEYRVVRI
jgi:hypothetical protein